MGLENTNTIAIIKQTTHQAAIQLTSMWFDPGLIGLFITSTLLHLGEEVNLLVVSSFWRRCRGGKFLYKL